MVSDLGINYSVLSFNVKSYINAICFLSIATKSNKKVLSNANHSVCFGSHATPSKQIVLKFHCLFVETFNAFGLMGLLRF